MPPFEVPSATRAFVDRLFNRWWRRQPPALQDRFATLGPLVSVLLFLAAIISAFWYLRNEEFERETEGVKRDTEIVQQQIRLHLIDNQEQLVTLARQIVSGGLLPDDFDDQAAAYAVDRPEVVAMRWLGADGQTRSEWSSGVFRSSPAASGTPAGTGEPLVPLAAETVVAMAEARRLRQPVYAAPQRTASGTTVFQLLLPLLTQTASAETLIVDYSVEALLRHQVPTELARRHAIAITDAQSRVLAGTYAPTGRGGAPAPIVHDLALAPAGSGLMVRGTGWRNSVGLIGNTLFWMVMALSALTLWMLLGTWRHVRRRAQIQGALVQETNFRRAMENSMLTGMRAMDLDGRITYVNPAFCAMTGFPDADLIGHLPPYPYWPRDRIDENSRLLQQELQGRSPAGGIEVKVMRKDGSVFDSRMYVSPLIDPRGQQTGWMTSMTNITEAKRIRDQLSASHERFTTVLEGLEAAVSVLSVQQGELLFANRSYRLWFGADAEGHAQLAGSAATAVPVDVDLDDNVDAMSGIPTQQFTRAGGEPREVHVASLQKWFDVRARYLQWTDGRLAQMLIATDISSRRRAEELAAQQAEKAQVSSRLITMGEMASSLAHELNQPLTAINNYCNGMISRIKAETIRRDDLITALEKTARQAERAGQIIHRVRAFVKKSEPQRQPTSAAEIVDDALELASLELRRRNVAIHSYVARRMPPLLVDPILIEQVVLNLVKNAAEAIDNANLPSSRRHIELRVVPRHTPDEGGVIEFSVNDTGPGLPDEVINRIYEAFFSTKADGLGIGLALCRSIVEFHRGRIKAQNLYNGTVIVGCRFSFTLPVDPAARSDISRPGELTEPASFGAFNSNIP
jgi:PAS domain S-box-containing protein